MNFENLNIIKYTVAIAIVLITLLIASVFRRFFRKFLEKSSEDLHGDITNYRFLLHSVTAVIIVVGFGTAIYSVPQLRTLANSMLAGAGILAVVIGFASQQALSNIIGGVFIVIFKPFRVNDRLKIRQDLIGIVEDITLRHTVIRDFENKRIIIPNSVISNEVVVNSNFTDQKLCRWIEIPIDFETDIDLVKNIMCEEVENHPFLLDNRSEEDKVNGIPMVRVKVLSINPHGLTLRAWAWAEDSPKAFELYCDVIESIKKRLDKEGIGLPYPKWSFDGKNFPIQKK